MYRRLLAQMALSGTGVGCLARALGLHYDTLRRKLNGQSAFLLDEAFLIKRLLGYQGALDTLFERAEG